MLRRKRVYICDRCGFVDLEWTWIADGGSRKGPPPDWTKLGKKDLCPICSAVYEKFKQQISAGKDEIK